MDEERLESMRKRVVGGPIIKTMIYLAAPIVAARMLSSTQELVDTILLGRVSARDLAAPTAAWPLIWLFMGLVFAVNTSTVAIVSQLVGAKRFKEASEAAGRLYGLVLLMSTVSTITIILIAPLVFRAQGVPDSVYPYALAYTYIDALALPFMATLFYFNSLGSSMGDTKTPFKLSALSSIINIVLDPILIFGLGPLPMLGVVGAAIATSISRIISGSLAFYILISGRLGITVKPLKPNRAVVNATVRIGGPIAGQQLIVSSGFLVMMGIVARLGDIVMAAYNVSLAIIHVIQNFTWGFNAATATMVGQSLGAGDRGRALKVALRGLILVSLMLSAGAVFLFVFSGALVRIFTDIDEVAIISERMIRILSLGTPFLGAFFVSMGVARGSGRTMFMSVLGVARLWLVRIPLAYLLVFLVGLGDLGIWASMAISNILAGIVAVAWVLTGRWSRGPVVGKRIQVIEETMPAQSEAQRR